MRVHVVSDVHGEAGALARAADGSDAFVCLGDLILFLDYADAGRGIFANLFGAAFAEEYIRLRTADDYEAARRVSDRAWEGIGVDRAGRWQVMESLVRAQYDELFTAMPSPAFVTPGNVDIPAMWPDYLRPGHALVDGTTVDVGGSRWGFVGGGLISPMRTPHELTPEDFAAKVDALGPVDVLFSHIPPAVPGLTYDVLARRFEVGSQALLEYVRREQPRYHLFGHVHSPLASRVRIGHSECVNVGHFQGHRQPFVLDL